MHPTPNWAERPIPYRSFVTSMQRQRKPTAIHIELALWSIIAAMLALWSTILVRQYPGSKVVDKENSTPDARYTWVGNDYPAYYPMDVGDAIMFPEDTMHYPINGDDALQQWETQFPTLGKGWVCLGPERRRFALSMYHELHCLGSLRLALGESANGTYDAEHVQHCLNYLRMMALCRADVTLEPVIASNLAVDLTQPHLCRDWVQVYEEASRNVGQCMSPGTKS